MSSKADIDNMCVFVMIMFLIKKTMKDESISVNKEIIWDEAKLGSPVAENNPGSTSLKNLVFQELHRRGDILSQTDAYVGICDIIA